MINETPVGQLGQYLIGDLGVARRHMARLKTGELPGEWMLPQILKEISDSIENCVARIQRDIVDKPR